MFNGEIEFRRMKLKEEVKVVFQSPIQKKETGVKFLCNVNDLNYYTLCDGLNITICIEVNETLYPVFLSSQDEGLRHMRSGTLLSFISTYCDEKYTFYKTHKPMLISVCSSLFGAVGRIEEFKEIDNSNKSIMESE